MPGDGSLLLQIVTMILTAGAVFGGIRGELKAMAQSIQRLEKATEKAHDRLDALGIGRRHGQ